MQPQLRSGPALDVHELQMALRVSHHRMARQMDVSAKTIERWEARGTPPSGRTARARLAQLQEIVDLGRIVWTPEGFVGLVTTPMPVFGGRTALQLIELGEGEQVMAAHAADYEGLGY